MSSQANVKCHCSAPPSHPPRRNADGGTRWATMQGNDIVLKDEKGAWSKITQANVFQSNGVIHVVDSVVLPN